MCTLLLPAPLNMLLPALCQGVSRVVAFFVAMEETGNFSKRAIWKVSLSAGVDVCDNPHSLVSRKLYTIAYYTHLSLFTLSLPHSLLRPPKLEPQERILGQLSVCRQRPSSPRLNSLSLSVCIPRSSPLSPLFLLSYLFSFLSAYTQHEYQVRRDKAFAKWVSCIRRDVAVGTFRATRHYATPPSHTHTHTKTRRLFLLLYLACELCVLSGYQKVSHHKSKQAKNFLRFIWPKTNTRTHTQRNG